MHENVFAFDYFMPMERVVLRSQPIEFDPLVRSRLIYYSLADLDW